MIFQPGIRFSGPVLPPFAFEDRPSRGDLGGCGHVAAYAGATAGSTGQPALDHISKFASANSTVRALANDWYLLGASLLMEL